MGATAGRARLRRPNGLPLLLRGGPSGAARNVRTRSLAAVRAAIAARRRRARLLRIFLAAAAPARAALCAFRLLGGLGRALGRVECEPELKPHRHR